ncbi:M20/M25/M40 family metallo-hydrolase [Salegentibacter chungangensis]|uniref:Vacuolar membrane protease n=1 Tax=Salegentibacter chungangensis TaxID=1335724 RepID=A0ABW3NL34_9FLAO
MLNKFYSFLSLVLIGFAVWFSFYSSHPHRVQPENAPSTEFSTSRAFRHVEAIAQKPHYTGSAEHSKVRNYIVNQLQEMGLQVQTQEGFILNEHRVLVRPQNILTRIKGTGNGSALVLMTHYDSQPHSSLGASDAGSGVATILEGIRAFLKQDPEPENDIILLFTDAEELGLNGAELFVKEHPWAKDAKLAINFEARGSGGNSFMLLETNKGNSALINAFQKAHPDFPVTNSLAYSVYKMLPNDTDLTVLREQGDINGFNFAFIDDHFDYHTANDIPANLDKTTLAHQGSYLMPLLNYFKDAELGNLDSDKDLLYFNLPGGELLSYPFSWIFPMLIAAFVIFLILLGIGFFMKRLNLKEVLRGFLPLFLCVVISGLSVYLFWKLCLLMYPGYSEIQQGFPYNGYYYIAAAVFLSLGICFFIYHKFRKKEDTVSLFIAPLFLWLLICTLTAFYLKGASYFIIPVYFGLLQLLIMIGRIKPNLLFLSLFSLPAIFILMPFIRSFPVALGLKILFVSAILTVLLFVLLLPVFGYMKGKKILGFLSLLTFFVLFFFAHFKSNFSAERPKPNSLVYLYDADAKKANWYTYDELLDEWTLKYFSHKLSADSEEKKLSSKYNSGFTYKADAAKISIPAPGIIFKKTSGSNDKTGYSLKIAPNRNINRLELFADTGLELQNFKVNGKTGNLAGRSERLLTYYVSGRDTLRLNFEMNKAQQPEFTLYESSYDLLENEQLDVPERAEKMIPRPFVVNDAVIFKKTITPERDSN